MSFFVKQIYLKTLHFSKFCLLLCMLVSSSANAQIAENKLGLIASHETWKLKDGELIGMTQLGVQTSLGNDLRAGVSTFAATTGDRGGFIVLGGQIEKFIRFGQNWGIETGIYVGGGGGRGGSTLTGGGLMLREHLGLSYLLNPHESLTFGVNRVDFPQSDAIGSFQTYVGYRLNFSALYSPGHTSTGTGLRLPDLDRYYFYRHQIGTLYQEVFAGGSRTYSKTAQENFGKLGISWRTYLNSAWFVQLNSTGAMRGGSRGYMDIVPGFGYERPIGKLLHSYVALGLGAGGGGDVDTGGGILLEPTIGLQYHFTRDWFVDGSASRLVANNGQLQSNSLNLKVGYEFGQNASTAPRSVSDLKAYPIRLRVVDQHYFKGSNNWRTEPDRSVGNLGAQVDYFVTPRIYLTGQGLGAYSGGAGAYMTGQLGAGFLYRVNAALFLQSEALIGAAGGGGLATGSGLIRQGNVGIGWQFSRVTSLLLSGGRIEAFNGDMKANVLGLSANYDFTGYSR